MTKIQWTEQTWNPMVGCSLESPGCTNCYAMGQTAWLANKLGMKKYKGLTTTVNRKPVWNGHVSLYPEDLAKPLHVRKPTMWFVNSMSDMFHPGFTDTEIDRVFEVMSLCPQHTFQILTKRAERMFKYSNARMYMPQDPSWPRWPLANVWLGVSAERQKEANERIPWLMKTPAAIRFVSCEPLLGSIELDDLVTEQDHGGEEHINALHCEVGIEDDEDFQGVTLDWVIVGGESGRGARDCQSAWVQHVVDQCRCHQVPVFVKQLGSKSDLRLKDKKGGDIFEFPESLRIREWPTIQFAPTAGPQLAML